MDYLTLLNALGGRVKPSANGFQPATSLDAPIADTGLDSLDVTLLAVYLCELHGIPEAVGKNLAPRTFSDIARFVEAHRTRAPASVEEALAQIS